MAKKFSFTRVLGRVVWYLFLAVFVIPMIAGYLSYVTNFGGIEEQYWLDCAVAHIKQMRADCDDPELQGILDYTAKRYNRIGPFDVAVSRCDWYLIKRKKSVLGHNNPLIPGVTLDIDVLKDFSLHRGTMVLVHEALHDYPPYFGHSYVHPMLDKLEECYVHSRPNCPVPRPSCPAPDDDPR